MVEIIDGIKFIVKQSSCIERHLPCGDKLIHFTAQYYDSSGRFVAQGGSPANKRSARSHARRSLFEKFGSHAKGKLNPEKLSKLGK